MLSLKKDIYPFISTRKCSTHVFINLETGNSDARDDSTEDGGDKNAANVI